MENKTQIFKTSDFTEYKTNVFITSLTKLIFKKKNTAPKIIFLEGVGNLKLRGSYKNDFGTKVYYYNNYVVGTLLKDSTTLKFW
tara:strand:+ start:318 stop:569 length:252 start_codon:yes stop_codon:yes gene_type:complete